MSFIVRKATAEDAEGTTRVHVSTWQSAYKGIVPQDHLDKMSCKFEKRVERWKRSLGSDNSDYTFVAEVDGEIVGFCQGGKNRHKEFRHEVELYAIYVLTEHQGKGIGRELTKSLTNVFLEEGRNGLLIGVLEENPAKTFYELLGGEILGKKEINIGGKSLIELCYGWSSLSGIDTKFCDNRVSSKR